MVVKDGAAKLLVSEPSSEESSPELRPVAPPAPQPPSPNLVPALLPPAVTSPPGAPEPKNFGGAMALRAIVWSFADLKKRTGLANVWTAPTNNCCLAFSYLVASGAIQSSKGGQLCE